MNNKSNAINLWFLACLILLLPVGFAMGSLEEFDFEPYPSGFELTSLGDEFELAFSNQGGKKRQVLFQAILVGRSMPNPIPGPEIDIEPLSILILNRSTYSLEQLSVQSPALGIPIIQSGSNFGLATETPIGNSSEPHLGVGLENSTVPSPGGLLILALAASTGRRRRR